MRSQRHSIYDLHEPIFHHDEEIVDVPLINKRKERVGYAIISVKDADYILQFSYNCWYNHSKVYARSGNERKSMHELVIGAPAPLGHVIDHINGNSLDNRRENLRYATHAQNAQNRPKKAGTKSRYIGVTSTKSGNWTVTISCKNKAFNCGTFEDETEAGKAYDVSAIHVYGIHAKTNGLLNALETAWIVEHGESIVLPTDDRPEKLPKNIRKHNDGFKLRMVLNGEVYEKAVPTLQAAINLKKAKLLETRTKRALKPKLRVTRNAQKYPVIKITKADAIVEVIVDEFMWRSLAEIAWSLDRDNAALTKKTVEGEYLMHRHIWVKNNGRIPGDKTIDHINGNRLDNQLKNLRLATRRLQGHNQKKREGSIDKYKGVVFRWPNYHAYIERKDYGAFERAEHAARRANEIFTQLYGKDARLNVIDWTEMTTCDNRISLDAITVEFVRELSNIQDIICVIKMLKLDVKQGGLLKITSIKSRNMDAVKVHIMNILEDQRNGIVTKMTVVTF